MQPYRRVNVRGIIFKDRELLCQKLTANQEGNLPSWWCTPGGGLDGGETLYEGLRREMIEETGITPQIGKLLFTHQFHDGEKEQIEFFFHITNPDDYQKIDLAATSHGLKEIAEVDFIDPASHTVLPQFLRTIDLQDCLDRDQPVLITSDF